MVPPEDRFFPAPIPESLAEGNGGLPPAVNSEAITKADPADWDMENLPSHVSQVSSHSGETESLNHQPSRIAASDSSSVSNRRPDTWESRNVVARRNILLVTLIAATGLLLAGTAFLVFVQSFGKPAERIAKNPPIAEPSDREKGTEKVLEGPPPEGQPQEVKDQHPQPGQEATNDTKPSEPSAEMQPPAVPTTDNVPDNRLPQNLTPNVDPAGMNETSEPVAPSPPDVEDRLPSVFEDFQRWIDAPSRGNWDDVGKSDRTIESEIALENSEVLFREEYYPASIPVPDWAERSQRKLVSVKTAPMPLLRCLHWFSKIANTGVSADWLELKLAGVDLNEPIGIEGQNASIGELLDQLCRERDLEILIDTAGFPRIRPTQERLQALIAAEGVLNTDKWISEIPAQDRDAWVPLVIRMLDLTQCQYVQGRLEWTAEASLYDRARFVAALQGLKQAATAPPEAVQTPDDAFDFGRPESWWKLREKVLVPVPMKNIVYEERPVMDLLSVACEHAGVQLVIDWPAAWSHGLHPSRMSVSVLRGRTLEEIANRYLEDYSLELVPLDSKTVLLTTDAVRRSVEQVVPIRLDRGMNIDDIKGAIRFLVPRGADQRSRFRWEPAPGDDQIVLLRVCLPALIHLRDSELQRAFGIQSPNTKIDRE